MTNNKQKNKYLALISVSDKDGIVDFAKQLVSLSFEIISTGGTSKELKNSGIPVTDISEKTNFPEIMGGRVKTLHPTIHAGILARQPEDNKILEQLEINKIDLVVVNLYPFVETISKPETTLEIAIENIDIGGPSMLRSAAKNNKYVGVVVDPTDYDLVLDELQKNEGCISEKRRFELAAKAFSHTAAYDTAISNYLSADQNKDFQENIFSKYQLKEVLRYGENPHQKAAIYSQNQKLNLKR